MHRNLALIRGIAAVVAACGFLVEMAAEAQVTTSTLSFQQGVAGYAGATDARITVTTATANTAGGYIDAQSGTGSGLNDEAQYFIRFDDIFGAGLIPTDATILDAQLTLTTGTGSNNQSNGRFVVAGMRVPFTTATSLTSLGNANTALANNGPTYANGNATLAVSGYTAPVAGSVVSAFVAPLVQDWLDGSLSNNGFVVQAHTTDAWWVNGIAATTAGSRPRLSVTYTTAAADTASLVPGVDGYAGMTMISMDGVSGITLDQTATPNFYLDGPTGGTAPGGASPDALALVRFDSIVGSAASQVPTRAEIAKSWLVLTTNSGSNSQSPGPYSVYRMTDSWDTSTTYAGFGPAGPVQGTDYLATPSATVQPMEKNQQAWFDVTADVQAWFDGTAANNGLLVRTSLTEDGWEIGSGGNPDPNRRPDLRTTYVVDSLVWKGNTSVAWDRGITIGSGGTENWQLATAGTATNFVNTDRVVFDDSAAGTGAVSVTLDEAVAPQLVTLANDARDYTLGGGGGIVGAGRLLKTGTGSATLATDNDYAGGTTVSAGTLKIGAGGSTGSITGNVEVAAGATLLVDRSGSLSLSGGVTGSGSLIKAGTARVALTAPTVFDGPIAVQAGTLVLAAGTADGGVTVTGGSLAISSGATPETFSTPTLTLASGAALGFELAAASNPTVPLLAVTQLDGLSLAGGHTLSLSSSGSLGLGRFTLLDYTGTAIPSGFSLAPLPQRLTGNLVFDTENTTVDLDITAADSLRWAGVSPTWDTGTAIDAGGAFNWLLASTGTTATNFFTGDKVAFTDGASSGEVSISGSVAPGSIVFDHSSIDYSVGGSGGITGAGTLTKQGAARTTLLVSNTSSGSTIVTAGTLQLGDASTAIEYAGDIVVSGGLLDARNATVAGGLTVSAGEATVAAGSIAGPVTVSGGTARFTGGRYSGGASLTGGRLEIGDGGGSGTLAIASGSVVAIENAVDLTYADVVSGEGEITKAGAGRVTFTSSSNGFTGTVTIDGGEVRIEDQGLGGDFGATAIVVNDGGTFQFGNAGSGNPDLPATTIITANAGGLVVWQESEDLGGVNLQGGTVDLQQGGLNATGSTPLAWTSGTLTGGTYTFAGSTPIVKTTSGEVLVSGSASITTTGGVSVEEGTLRLATAGNVGSGVLSLGSGSAGATLQFDGGSVTRAGAVTLGAAATISVTDPAATLTIATGLVGPGSLRKTGAGSLALTAAGTYTGGSTVEAGTLVAGVPRALGIGNVTVGSGGTLVVSTTLDLGAGNSVTTQTGGVVSLTSGGSLPLAAGTSLEGFTTASAATTASILAGTVAAGGGTMASAWLPTQVGLFADVLELTTPTGSTPFVLAISYSPTLDPLTASGLALGWNATAGGSPTWVNAVAGNLTSTASGAQVGYLGSFADFQTQYGSDLSSYVGAYGRDPVGENVWAVVDHNSQFSIVPEPATAGLIALTAVAALAGIRRRRAAAAERG